MSHCLVQTIPTCVLLLVGDDVDFPLFLLPRSLHKLHHKHTHKHTHTHTHTYTHTPLQVAIKIIEIEKIKEEYVKKNLLREAQLMRRLRHPNIIRLYETMKTNTIYCLVTEIAEGGELLSHVKLDCKDRKLPEASARNFVRQLVSALDYLHSSGIVHRLV